MVAPCDARPHGMTRQPCIVHVSDLTYLGSLVTHRSITSRTMTLPLKADALSKMYCQILNQFDAKKTTTDRETVAIVIDQISRRETKRPNQNSDEYAVTEIT